MIIFSPQPRALAEFYCAAFGLEIISTEGSFVDIGSPDSLTSRIGFHKGKSESKTSMKLCFYTPNFAAERERLIGLGVQMNKQQSSTESLCFCDGKDTKGNVFQITNRS